MSGDFFDRLESELGTLAHAGAHLERTSGLDLHRLVALIRHSVAIVTLAVLLAGSLLSEFPASAGGHAVGTQVTARVRA